MNDNTLSISAVTTIEDVVGGEWVHDNYSPHPYWKPRCFEAWTAIRAGVTHVLRSVAGRWSEENRDEAECEVKIALGKYLGKRPGSHITNTKFLESKNRAGWLNLFAQKTTRGWIRDRIRVANGDERVRQAVAPGCVIPAETFTAEQERLGLQNESLQFDAYQFQFGRGHIPAVDDDGVDPCEVEHQSSESGHAENIILLRDTLAALPPEESAFLLEYVDSRYKRKRSSADRKRFQRLKSRVRSAMSRTA